jgi:glycosyltransferase involved in cell wall biosynthesis
VARRPSVLFLGRGYAGHHTRFLNLRAQTERDPRLRPIYREVTGWDPDGWIERLPRVPAGLKGRARATLQAAPLAMLPRPDVIWAGVVEMATPYLWAQLGPLRRPLVLDLDATSAQLEEMAPTYFGRPARRGLRLAAIRLRERLLWRTVSLFTPWSNWAAASLRRQGVDDRRIRVLPPGIDLELWRPRARPRDPADDKVHLLFVGGDFVRKGGDMLLDVFRARFADRCTLDVVSHDTVPSVPGVSVHRAGPNSSRLRELYGRADLFVLPTRADCFGLATVEALASGVPAIMTDTGGASDIVDHGETGWLIRPTTADLAAALEHAVTHRADLPRMGRRARQAAEERFDGRRNGARVVDLLLDLARQS